VIVVEARQVRALLWALLPRSWWFQPETLLAITTGESAALSSLRSGGEG
jgi:hypothetical protein